MPPIQTQIAKITPPLLTDILPRKRLFSLFDRTMKKPVIWVSAPGGSGKTTLVSSYLMARKRPCIWYQVDDGDSEIATFFYYMGLAAKKAGRRKKPLPLLTPEYIAGLSTFTRHYFEQLFSSIKAPFTLVFDNYQDVSSEALIHRAISAGLSLLPKGINVVMISRNDPPAEFARLRANSGMGFIGWDDIQFSLEEMRNVLRERGAGKISAEVVRQLHEKTEGWIAGLVLYMERAKTEGLDTDAFEKIARGGIFDYFATEVFRKADAATQDFLLKTAFLPQVASSIAEKLTDCIDAGQILKRLSQDHFFTTRHSGRDAFFQYHTLFRDFLLAKANVLWSADKVHNVRRSAALLLEEAGRTEDAVDLFLRAESWTEVGRVIGLKAQAMLSQGRSEVVRSWLDRLPKEIVSKTPQLLYWRGVCVMPFNPPESRKNFEKALELFRKEKDSAWMFLSWAAAVDVAIYSDEYAYLDSLVEMFDGFVKEGISSPSPEIDARIGMSMFNALSFRQPNHPDIDKWEERAFGLLHMKNLDVNIRVQLGFYMHIYHLYMGNFPRARLIMTTIEGALSNNVSDLMFIMFKHQCSLYDYFTGNYDTTPEKIAQALDRAYNTGIHVSTYQLNCIKASLALCGGDIASAAHTMKELSAGESSARPFDRGYYHFLRAWEAVLQGRTADAVQHAQLTIDQVVTRSGMALCESFVTLLFAEVLHESGDEKKAAEHLSMASDLAHRMKSKFMVFSCLLAETHMMLDLHQDDKALDALRAAMTIGCQQKYLSVLFWRPNVMASLCAKALEAGIEVKYVQKMIVKRNLVPATLHLHPENWPWPVKVYSLGKFRIEINGEAVVFTGKVQQKPLEMLKVLIALGGKEVSEEQITDILWPDTDGDLAHRSFETTLYRLRKLLVYDKAIQLQAGRLELDLRYCWVDARAFINLLEKAEKLLKKAASGEGSSANETDEIDHLVDKAFALYQGDFLNTEKNEPWSLELRERLRAAYLKYALKVGAFRMQYKRYEEALDIFHKGLEVDDLTEELYQQIMTCYHHLGRGAEAVKVYNKCRTVLNASLGIDPSPKTDSIFRLLTKN